MGDSIEGLTKSDEFLPRLVSMVMVAALTELVWQGEEVLDRVMMLHYQVTKPFMTTNSRVCSR